MQEDILVVDDDPDVLDILSETLNKRGYNVVVALDAQSALRSFKRKQPSLVILDIMLPDMDGLEVFKRMRADQADRYIPILFLSSNGDLETKLSGFDMGAEDYLVKPVSLKELNAKIGKILKRTSQAQALWEEREALETEVTKEHENYIHINKQLKKQVLAMKTLFSISQDLTRILELDELINAFALTIVGELRISSMAFFALVSENSKILSLRGVKGFRKEKFAGLEIPRDCAFVEWLGTRAKPKKIVRSNDRTWVKRLPDIRLAAFEYATPIMIKDKMRGIVFTGPKLSRDDYTPYDLDMLQFICNSAGVGMENARLFKELQTTYLSTVKTLVSIIEAKDSYTRGHTERVAEYAIAIAERMNLPQEEQRRIAFGAVLHDIGKLGVLEKVLNKKEQLDTEEWKILKAHPEVGASIIENMEFLTGTVELVRHHHENWNGKGYPDGLKGEEIPIGSRIIAVADGFDAMTTDRPYRKALKWTEALSTIKEGSGIQYDPEVVRSFEEIIRDKNFRKRMREKHSNP
ncbi:MAG: response regulator [Candidatus Latescibacteria bacterium]|nr:response regulator [Candidatus Latescibacterota bacterium]NIM66407.1 response regulator [Candidatus Latescibacterota bacterium]NIO02886.1 response regulator [Candidatus Latescibacterota bacterium]NIO30021.1 response regulator [Candidatus Latescibacterota bacterium]NIO57636.1 response regulator [Candidatus Latescibacterota bacterium]